MSANLIARHERAIADAMINVAEPMKFPPMVYRLRRKSDVYAVVGSVDAVEYCYTRFADMNGDFWAFCYVREATTTVMSRRVRAASIQSASKRARDRFKAARKRAGKAKE